MRRFSLGMLALASVALSDCAYTDQFNGRVATYDVAAAQWRNSMILTNIVRASRAEPLSFVQLGQISGSAGVGATVGLPSVVFGPHPASAPLLADTVFGGLPSQGSGFVGNQGNITGSTNFAATPNETKDFYIGLLREVEPRTLELFIEQGVARELLFYLFTDKLIEDRGGVKRELRNDPLDANFAAFQTYVRLAMDYGLSSERAPELLVAEEGLTKHERWRLCFNRMHMAPDARPADNQPVCGSGHWTREERTVSFMGRDGKRVLVDVLPRSTYAIFEYLGRIVAAGERGRIRLVSPEAIDQPPLMDETLFALASSDPNGCFVGVAFEGANYCVPRDGATNTKRILGLLAQLIALNTAIADIPVTPSVRIVP